MLRYNSTLLGTVTIAQNEYENGKLIGKEKFKIDIRQGNCLAVFVHIYKIAEPKDPSKPYMHQLVTFFVDEAHLKNCLKHYTPAELFSAQKITDFKLNVYYKEARTLLKHFTKAGCVVKAYYKAPKATKRLTIKNA